MRGASTAAATFMSRATTFATTCMIAPRSRALPALPMTKRGAPSFNTIDGAIIDVSRSPGCDAPDQVELAEHVVQMDARARHDDAAARAEGRA